MTRIRRRQRGISGAIIVGVIAVGLSIAMLVAWILVLVYSDIGQTWLLVIGIISLSFIGLVLGAFAVLLVREQLEVRRQFGFIDSVTHELKSPLAGLKLSLETLARADLPDGAADDLRGMMHTDVQRLSAFIDDVLTANRLGHDRKLQLSEIDLVPLIHRAADHTADRHGLRPDTIERIVPDALPMRTDPTAVVTVLRNLLDNAVKYSDPPVNVRVEVELLGNGHLVHLRVRDHGIGLTGRDQRRVLQRFYRVDREAVRRRRGTGLGLYVVQALVQALGGRVRLESPGEGRGTTVHIHLPTRSKA